VNCEEEEEPRPVRTMEQMIKGIMELDEEKKSEDENSEGFCSSDDELDPFMKNKPV